MEQKTQQFIDEVLAEVDRAESLHPIYPAPQRRGDHVYAAAILHEEAGEVTQASLNWQVHGKGTLCQIHSELVQTAAMCVRYSKNIEAIERQRINDSARQELADEHTVYAADGDAPIYTQKHKKDDGAGGGAIAYATKPEALIFADYRDPTL